MHTIRLYYVSLVTAPWPFDFPIDSSLPWGQEEPAPKEAPSLSEVKCDAFWSQLHGAGIVG